MFKATASVFLSVILCISLFVQAQQEPSEAQVQTYMAFTNAINNPDATVAEMKAAFDNAVAMRAFPEGRECSLENGPVQMLRFFDYALPRVGEDGKLRAFTYWEALEYINASLPRHPAVQWQEIGPSGWGNIAGHWNPGIGRFNGICEDPKNKNVIYIGTPAGGCWKSIDAGTTWKCLTDHLPALGVTSIAVDYNNSNIVYLGTGDGDAGNVYSIGVLKSTDGGANWNTTGMTFELSGQKKIHKLMIHPTNSSVLFAAMNDGLYRTEDAAATWTKVSSGNTDDVEFKPQSPDIMYAMISNTFYRSTNGGTSFSPSTGGLPSSAGRSLIGVTKANPEYVYILSSKTSGAFQGVYRSTNSGVAFTLRGDQPSGIYGYNTDGSSTSNQTSYDLAFTVSPVNAEEAHLGNILTWKTMDGGTTWKATTAWRYPVSSGYEYTHCDIHVLEYFENRLYVGSDGLVCRSTNSGDDFTDIVNNQVSVRQFYKIAVAQGDVTKIVGGAQDNGTCYYDGNKWWDWMGADGMDCMVSPDGNTMYGTTQGGSWTKRVGTSNTSMTQPGGGAWVTPAAMHPADPKILFVGNDAITKSTDGGSTWKSIGLDGSNMVALAVCKSNPDYIYATRSTNVYGTKNGGSAWSTFTSSNGLPSASASNVAVNPVKPDEVVATYSGFTAGRKVYRSINAGTSWENYSKNLPNIPANCAAFDNNGNLFVGMDIGVYCITPGSANYMNYSNGMPNVVVKDLDMHYTKNLLYAGTYGRGAWFVDVGVVNKIMYDNPSMHKTIRLFNNCPNPFRQSTDIRFEMAVPGRVTLTVHTMLGKKVATLADKDLPAGTHSFVWNGRTGTGRKLSTGVYIYKIRCGDFTASKRMMMAE